VTAGVPSGASLFLEDLHVGLAFDTATYTMDEAEMMRFAREFDPQPFHLDHEAARQSIFGGLVASGWHTAALSMRLLVQGGPPLAGGLLGAGGELRWPLPTRAGDTLHVHSELLEVTPSRSRPDRGIVTMRNETRNQRGEVVQTFVVKIVVPRRAAPDGAP
jgi:acyl dehydratase